MCIHIYVYICIYMYTCMCIYVYVCVFICVNIYIWRYTCKYIWRYTYLCIYLCTYTCLYIHEYVHTHLQIYIFACSHCHGNRRSVELVKRDLSIHKRDLHTRCQHCHYHAHTDSALLVSISRIEACPAKIARMQPAECPAGIYRSLLQKSPIKEPVFFKKEL